MWAICPITDLLIHTSQVLLGSQLDCTASYQIALLHIRDKKNSLGKILIVVYVWGALLIANYQTIKAMELKC